MAKNVTGQVLGGRPKTFDGVKTVGDVMTKLELSGNYSATVNGEPATLDQPLKDYEYVSFTESVKGA